MQQHLLTRLRAWQGHKASLCPWSEVTESAGLMAPSWAAHWGGAPASQPHTREGQPEGFPTLAVERSALSPPCASCCSTSPCFPAPWGMATSWECSERGRMGQAPGHCLPTHFRSVAWEAPVVLPALVTLVGLLESKVRVHGVRPGSVPSSATH